MKIEMDEISSVTTVICTIVICAAIASIAGCRMCEQTNQEAIKAGLVQKSTPPQGPHWTKP